MGRLDAFTVRLLQWNFPDGHGFPGHAVEEELEAVGLCYDEAFCRTIWMSRRSSDRSAHSLSRNVKSCGMADDSDCESEDGGTLDDILIHTDELSGVALKELMSNTGARLAAPEVCALDCTLSPFDLVRGKSVDELVSDWKTCELLNSGVSLSQGWHALADDGKQSDKAAYCAEVAGRHIARLEVGWKKHAGKGLTHLHRVNALPPEGSKWLVLDSDGWVYMVAFGELPGAVANAIIRAMTNVRILIVSLESEISKVSVPAYLSSR
eukprot:4217464-Amphidinium_carterae.1